MTDEGKHVIAAVGAVAAAAVLGFGLAKWNSTTPEFYNAYSKIEYNNQQYHLYDLYRVTGKDGAQHICKLDPRSHSEGKLGLKLNGKLGFVIASVSDPGVYVDLDTGEELTLEGYEDIFGYTVEPLKGYFPFSKYGGNGAVLISQSEFEDVILVPSSNVQPNK